MYLNTRIFPTTGYARVLLFMFIRQELRRTGTGCFFQFTYCVYAPLLENRGLFNGQILMWLTLKNQLCVLCPILSKGIMINIKSANDHILKA